MFRILLFIGKYACFCKAIEFVTHPSKNPTILGLYSYDKSLAILVLILFGFILHKIRLPNLENKDLSVFNYPIQTAFVIIFISYLFQINTNLALGVDFATQLKSLLQWVEGTTVKWNTIKLLDINDLRDYNEKWSFRPPAAMVYYIPFVYLSIPLGESLRLGQLILAIITIISWFRIGRIFKLNSVNQFILTVSISIWLSTLFSFVGNVQLLVTAFSSVMTLIAIMYINNARYSSFHDQFKFYIISFFLGFLVLFKLSAIIYNGAILLFCIIFIIMKSYMLDNKIFIKNLISCIFSSLLFITPFIFLNLINSIHNINLDVVYKQDYNNDPHYQFLWGRYFSETTNFPAVIISFLSSWSTFSPLNTIQTFSSNALTYLGFLDSFIYDLELNPKVMHKAIFGIILTIPIIYLIKLHKIKFEIKSIFLISVLTTPFIIFTILAYRHGYNYLITGTYNQQYLPVFILFFVVLLSDKNKNKSTTKLYRTLLFLFSIVFFNFSNVQKVFLDITQTFSKNIVGHEHISNEFYGNNVTKVSNIVNLNRKDLDTPVIFFANTSIAENSIIFKGDIGGIADADEWCKNSNSSLETFNRQMFLLFDSRLKYDQINSIFNKINYKKSKKLLDLKGTAKVYFLN